MVMHECELYMIDNTRAALELVKQAHRELTAHMSVLESAHKMQQSVIDSQIYALKAAFEAAAADISVLKERMCQLREKQLEFISKSRLLKTVILAGTVVGASLAWTMMKQRA